jgi:hypothetical protein
LRDDWCRPTSRLALEHRDPQVRPRLQQLVRGREPDDAPADHGDVEVVRHPLASATVRRSRLSDAEARSPQ